jgi:hypothetical protein
MMHFPWTVFIAFSLAGILMVACYCTLFVTSPENVLVYQNLKEAANPVQSEEHSNTYVAKQKRIGIQKDILFTEGEGRLQFRLTSTHSELVLDHHDEQNEIMENLHNIKCIMQEELYYLLPTGQEAVKLLNSKVLIRNADQEKPESWIPISSPGIKPMQIIRYIEAEEASYYYQSGKFVADQVKIFRYEVPGHTLIEPMKNNDLIMKGTAQSIEFSIMDKEINFKANQFKASFFSSRRLL